MSHQRSTSSKCRRRVEAVAAPRQRDLPNTRLIAAVQNGAGARCHEAANYLAMYKLYAHMHHAAITQNQTAKADLAARQMRQSEQALRQLLLDLRCRRSDAQGLRRHARIDGPDRQSYPPPHPAKSSSLTAAGSL